MKTTRFLLAVITLLCMSTNFLQALELPASPALQSILDGVVKDTLQQFSDRGLKPEQLAVTVVDLKDANKLARASYRGSERIYPASVVKLFYLLAAHQWMEEGKITDTEELRRAMKDMIVESSNDATGYIVDLLTETTSGPELSAEELAKWQEKRNAVNRYLVAQGYTNINVNRKPWGDGPYGRETQSSKISAPNHRNWLTTDATARLMTEIALGKAISAKRSAEMRELLSRDPKSTTDRQALYTGAALPTGAKLWSKAGWTSQSRHDAAYVELPDAEKLVIVVFTDGHANNFEIVPYVAKKFVQQIHKTGLRVELRLERPKVKSMQDAFVTAVIKNAGKVGETINSREITSPNLNLRVVNEAGKVMPPMPPSIPHPDREKFNKNLMPGEQMVVTYKLSMFAGELPAGKYRVIMEDIPANEVVIDLVPGE